MSGSESGDRSEAATPRRLMQAREAGQAPLSREATPFAVLAVSALLLTMSAPVALHALLNRLARFLTAPAATPPSEALRAAMMDVLLLAGPFLIACALAGVIAVLTQTGGLVSSVPLMPDLARLDPRRGLSRVFSWSALLELGKSLLKLAAAAGAVWMVLGGIVGLLPTSLYWDPARLLDSVAREVLRVMLAMLGAQGALAALDIIRSRIEFAGSMRMTRQEVRDEHKETEGDPHIKQRIRRLRMQRAKRRMLKAVPKAAVIVTNPTHYAVALAYQRGSASAPRVVAKGMDTLAERIRDIARAHNVPIVANPPLARALHGLDLESEIPRELYQTVAEVIAYVWRLRSRVA